jgi:hypothetical protein
VERLAARAGDRYINVFWVNSWFHVITLYRRHAGRDFKRDILAEQTVSRKDAKPPRRSFNFASLRLCVKLSLCFAPRTHHLHTPE